MRSKIDKEKLEKLSFRTFAELYPHEAFMEYPVEFWEYFKGKHPEISYKDMVETLEKTKEP